MILGKNDLWSTPIFLGEFDKDLCLDLYSTILNEFPQFILPNENSSSFDIINDEREVFKKFRKEVIEPNFDKSLKSIFEVSIYSFKKYWFKSWIVRQNHQYIVQNHNHSGSSLSGVFYLFMDKDFGGELVFSDPRPNANRGFLDEFKPHFENKKYQPKKNQFIIFPGYIYHQTLHYPGNCLLSVPVDLYLSNA